MLLFEPIHRQMHWCALSDKGRVEGSYDPRQTIPDPVLQIVAENRIIGFILPHGGLDFYHPISELHAFDHRRLEASLPFNPEANGMVLKTIHDLAPVLLDRRLFILSDTAYFMEMPQTAQMFALPQEYLRQGVRRFGGDGLCHQWAWEFLSYNEPDARLVSIHLGDRPSVAAIYAGETLESSMGFSATAGLPSLFGCGDIDPAIPLVLMEEGLSAGALEQILTNESGLAAVAGHDEPLSAWINENTKGAVLARQMLIHQLLKNIGAAIAALGGVDIVAFIVDGGDELQPIVNALCDRLSFLAVQPVDHWPARDDYAQTGAESKVKTVVLPYDRWQAVRSLLVSTLF